MTSGNGNWRGNATLLIVFLAMCAGVYADVLVSQKTSSEDTKTQTVTVLQVAQLRTDLQAATNQMAALSGQLSALSNLPDQVREVRSRVTSLETNYNALRDKERDDKAARDLQMDGLTNRVSNIENGVPIRNPFRGRAP